MGSSSHDTIQKQDPWAGQQPYLSAQYSSANNYLNAQNPTVSPMTGTQQYASTLMAQRGLNGSPVNNSAQNQVAATNNGYFLSAGNPYFQNMVDQSAQAIRPQIDSQFEASGRYGGGAHEAAMDSALTNMAGNLAYQNYGQERQNQMQSAELSPQLANQDYQDINALYQAGSLNQDQYQQELNAPLQRLQNYASLIQGNVGSQVTTPYFTNPTTGALGGAAAGYAATKSPWGAVAGGLMGYLGNR